MNKCGTCQWWFRYDGDPNWGKCVYHLGVKGEKTEQVKFSGSLVVKVDFGCVKHREKA